MDGCPDGKRPGCRLGAMEGRLADFADSDVGLEHGCEDGCLEDIVGGVRPAVGSEVGLAFGCHVGRLEGSQLRCNERPVGCLDGVDDGYDHGSISGLNVGCLDGEVDGSVDGSDGGLDDGNWVGSHGSDDSAAGKAWTMSTAVNAWMVWKMVLPME